MPGRVLALVIVWLALALAAPGAYAQASPQAAPQAAPQVSPQAQLDEAQHALKALEQSAHKPDLDDAALGKLVADVAPIQAEILAALDPLHRQISAVDARLSALGPAPAAGAPPEAGQIAQDRKAMTGQHTALDAQIKRGKLLQIEADQLVQRLASRRIDSFSQRVGARTYSVADPGLWRALAEALPTDAERWVALAQGEMETLRDAATPRSLGVVAVFAVLAGLLIFPARLLLRRAVVRLAEVQRASARLREAEIATASVFMRSALPVMAAAVMVWGLDWAGLLSAKTTQLAWALVWSVGMTAAAYALGRTVLAPNRAEHRLLRISDAAAQALARYPLLLGGTAALGAFVLQANRVAGVSLWSAVSARALVAAADLIILGFAVSAAGRALAVDRAAEKQGAAPPRGHGLWTLCLMLTWIAIGVGAAALFSGYIAFAVFLTQEIVWGATVVAVVFVLTNLSDALFAEVAPEEGLVGRFAATTLGLSQPALDQLSVLLAGVARLVLWLLGWAAILLPFGAGAQSLSTQLQAGVTSFKLGGVVVSPPAIAAAIGLFVAGLLLTRMFRRWLETSYLPRTRLDRGLSATIASGISYVGGLLALIVASSYLGLKLTQVTLIASALTVGIGFGLQAVIQNFVAGIILLAGRPIRVGDWIAVAGLEGDVQRINVRATEVKLFDGSVLIVPNSELVTKPVRNVTWGTTKGQVRITFIVGYDADLDVVAAALLEAMKQTRGVLKEPAPAVAVTDFLDAGAAFVGTASIASPRSGQKIKSDILLELSRRLRAAGIRPGVEFVPVHPSAHTPAVKAQ